ncbi:hypothetical protein [Agromyces sp. PvR057]|uniref:hypothetical protein n=1 Tax=Agromyces sp. PvR057 TaxID=3156403 RepID=UPI003397EC26
MLNGLLGVPSGGDVQGGPGQFPGDGERPDLPDGGGPWQGGQSGDQGDQQGGDAGTSDGTNS